MRRQTLALCLVALGCETSAPRSFAPAPMRLGEPRRAQSTAGTTPVRSGPRLGILDAEVLVHERPRQSSTEIGVLHFGAEVKRAATPVSHDGCADGWYAVEPEGFVCHGRVTTLEPDAHPLIRAARARRTDFSSPTPYRWYESRGEAPLYRRLPTEREQRRSEPELERHLRRVASRHRSLDGVDLTPATAPPPDFLKDHAISPWSAVHTPRDPRARVRFVPARSTVAVTGDFVLGGRSFLVTSDLLVTPKDRLVALEPSTFEGVQLDGERTRLPIAFVRREPKPKFRIVQAPVVPAALGAEPGRLEPTGESWPRLTWMGLTGRERTQRGTRYLETRSGDWIRADDATVVAAQPPQGFELEPGEKWIDISVFRGTLVAYEGNRAVFATLISPGANGYKREHGKPAQYTTPTGTFRLEWKHRSTTMTPDPERRGYTLAEVPFTQFFHMPFALHAAYWHDRFGEPKSGGCVNLSPRDAKWLFAWTEPVVPDAWHGVRSGGSRGNGTWVRVR